MMRSLQIVFVSVLILGNVAIAAKTSSYLRASDSTETEEASSLLLDSGSLPRHLKKNGPKKKSGGGSARKNPKGTKGKHDKHDKPTNSNGGSTDVNNSGQIPNEAALVCAGLQGIPCPEGYSCVDDPSNCGIAADCLGICVEVPKCAGLLGLQCPDGLVCVNDPTNCGIAADCLGICVDASLTCGGSFGEACPDGLTCIDDSRDNCDPGNGGADCGGICIVSPVPPVLAPGDPSQGGDELPRCGGPENITCLNDLTCVDNPKCTAGSVDCLGTCTYIQMFCGGSAALECPDGLTCVDDPSDSCDPNNGGADCGGVCVYVSGPPVVDVPNFSGICPLDVPRSDDACPTDFEIGARCGYGSVCCCDTCYTETTCTCSDAKTFQCASIAIKCNSDCPVSNITTPIIPDEPAMCTPSMSAWPDLVGRIGEEAKAFLESSEPCLTVITIVLEGSAVTTDYVFTRVRIIVNDQDIVVAPPMIG